MNFDARQATELLITNVHRIPVKRVVCDEHYRGLCFLTPILD